MRMRMKNCKIMIKKNARHKSEAVLSGSEDADDSNTLSKKG